MKTIYYLLALCSVFCVDAQNALTPGYLRVDASFQSIAVNYAVLGDVNLNSTLTLRYRVAGSSDAFEPSAKTMRTHPNMIVDGNAINLKFPRWQHTFLTTRP